MHPYTNKTNKQLFLEPKSALSQKPMRPKAEWAIDSKAMRARGIIIVLVESNQLVKKPTSALFATSGL